MTEEFICWLWQHKVLGNLHLKTTDNEEITIEKSGERNTNGGPDFLNARLKIGNTLWAGNVEVHLNAADWQLHKHQLNKAYNNVILHVVFNNNATAYTEQNTSIPTLELKNNFPHNIFEKYTNLVKAPNSIACSYALKEITPLVLSLCIQRMALDRIEEKSKQIRVLLKENENSWETTFYWLLAHYFGSNVNGQTFECLAKSLDLTILAKHKDNLFQLEALLFGQSGLLDADFYDEYPTLLQKEYSFLQKKYRLISLQKHQWQFLRMRPNGFPTIRISQFAHIIYRSQSLFSKILASSNASELFTLFEVSASDYWQTHYLFDVKSETKKKNTGTLFIQNLLINVVAPLLFEYGVQHDNQSYKDKALELLESLSAEKNNIITEWQTLGIKATNALESQGLIQLYKNYCKQKQCLQCAIGTKVIYQK